MKAINYWLLIVLLSCCAVQAYPQKTTDAPADPMATQIIIFQNQAKEWKKKVDKNFADEKAWFRYAQTLQTLKALTAIQSKEGVQKEINAMLEGMKRHIPNTATYALVRNMNAEPGQRDMTLEEIMDKWPDAVLHYPTYLGVSLKNEERLKDICTRWYESGEFPPQYLHFAYNELASADKDAIIFIGGNLDSYGSRVLQQGKDVFKDKKIVTVDFLSDFMYMNMITEELGIPEYKDDSPMNFSSIGDFMEGYSKKMKKRLSHIICNTARPVYFTITVEEPIKNIFKNNLYPEGLLMKYSLKPYDNIAFMRRNFENIYLLDYLRESFYPETLANTSFDPKGIEILSLFYIPAFKSLLQFYKESGDQTHYEKLYLLLQSIIRNAKNCSESVREQYLNSINI